MFVIQGVKLIPVAGQSVSSGMILPNGDTAPGKFDPAFLLIDRGTVGPVPIPVVIMLVLVVASWFVLTRTSWGRVLYAVGANPEAARLSGIRVGLYRSGAYVVSALFASVAGIILVSRIGQGDVNAGSSSLLEAVAVALVGTSVLGMAKPNAWGTLLGAVLVAIVLTGMTMAGFQYYFQDTRERAGADRGSAVLVHPVAPQVAILTCHIVTIAVSQNPYEGTGPCPPNTNSSPMRTSVRTSPHIPSCSRASTGATSPRCARSATATSTWSST